jgi:hypothetical protein
MMLFTNIENKEHLPCRKELEWKLNPADNVVLKMNFNPCRCSAVPPCEAKRGSKVFLLEEPGRKCCFENELLIRAAVPLCRRVNQNMDLGLSAGSTGEKMLFWKRTLIRAAVPLCRRVK